MSHTENLIGGKDENCYLLVNDGACHLPDVCEAEVTGVQHYGFAAQPDLNLEGDAMRPRKGTWRTNHRRSTHEIPECQSNRDRTLLSF